MRELRELRELLGDWASGRVRRTAPHPLGEQVPRAGIAGLGFEASTTFAFARFSVTTLIVNDSPSCPRCLHLRRAPVSLDLAPSTLPSRQIELEEQSTAQHSTAQHSRLEQTRADQSRGRTNADVQHFRPPSARHPLSPRLI